MISGYVADQPQIRPTTSDRPVRTRLEQGEKVIKRRRMKDDKEGKARVKWKAECRDWP